MRVYKSAKNIAKKLLGKFGKKRTFTRTTSTGFNPVTGTNTVTTSTFVLACITDVYGKNEIDGTLVQNGDVKLITESTTEPLIGDTVPVRNKTYRVMSVNITSPDDTDIVYELQIR